MNQDDEQFTVKWKQKQANKLPVDVKSISGHRRRGRPKKSESVQDKEVAASVSGLLRSSDRSEVRASVGLRAKTGSNSKGSDDGKVKATNEGSVSPDNRLPSKGDVGVRGAGDGAKPTLESGTKTEGTVKVSSGVGSTSLSGTIDLGALMHPDMFSRGILGTKLYEWQARTLRRIEKNWCKVALCAANESGKTSTIIVPAVLWHMIIFPGSMTVVTAKQERQIVHTLMGALKQYSPMLSQFNPKWTENELVLTFPDGKQSKMIGFTTNEGARFESFHNMPGAPLMIIVDECKEIADDIFVAVDRCNPLRRLYASSPSNNPIGRFHQIVTENPEGYELEFVSAFDCPHISAKRITDAEKAYGKDSSIYRSMILGLPTEDNEDCIFSASAVDGCMGELAPKWIKGDEVVFIDWSTGGDEIVVAHRNGNKVTMPLIFTTDRNRVGAQKEILDRVEHCLKELKMNVGKNKYVFADDDGIGWGFNNQLRERGWGVQLFRGGAKPMRSAFYQNRITECWYTGAHEVSQLKVILPKDKKLRFQLVGRKKRRAEDNPTLIRMQQKSDLPHSPDRGDAVIGCITLGPPLPEPKKEVKTVQYNFDEDDDFKLDNENEIYIRGSGRKLNAAI